MFSISDQTPRYALLQRLERIGKCVWMLVAEPVDIPTQAKTGLEWATFRLRFAKEEMNMVGHDYVAINVEPVTTPGPFQC
jgi:hypothetical protein